MSFFVKNLKNRESNAGGHKGKTAPHMEYDNNRCG